MNFDTSEDDRVWPEVNIARAVRSFEVRYNGRGDGYEVALSLAVSPDGSKVFVTGQSQGIATCEDYVTIAYVA